MIDVILHCPEIPQNTGNIGRICAFAGCRLHLIHPLGFEITDRNLKRAGMDYWHALDVFEHSSWQDFYIRNTDQREFIYLPLTPLKHCGKLIFVKMMVCFWGMKAKEHQRKYTNGLMKIASLYPSFRITFVPSI